jgi:hypothetical protein
LRRGRRSIQGGYNGQEDIKKQQREEEKNEQEGCDEEAVKKDNSQTALRKKAGTEKDESTGYEIKAG